MAEMCYCCGYPYPHRSGQLYCRSEEECARCPEICGGAYLCRRCEGIEESDEFEFPTHVEWEGREYRRL